ncbi:MAG: hypothetical protein AB1726_09390 [Planctomycetota bacterium]
MRPLLLSPFVLLALVSSACRDGSPPASAGSSGAAAGALPPPTEHLLDAGAEGDQRRRREEWFEERHAAPPGTDWRAIERANGEAQIAKRNRLASLPTGTLHWAERGSDNQAGRMHVAAISPDGQTLYAGSSLGGLWKGTLEGTSWTPLGDNLYGGVHWLVALPGDGGGFDRLLAATDGGRIHLTRDDGATWVVPAGLPADAGAVRRVVATSDGSYTVFLVAASGSSYRLYRSTDYGESFVSLVAAGLAKGDVWVPRNGGSDVYYVKGSELWRSSDRGATWTVLSSTPLGATTVEIAGSEAGAPRLWILTGGANLYRSDDAGLSWSFVDAVTDIWWGGSHSASIVDADAFAYGGVEVHRTYDAGATWSIVNSWGAYYGNPAGRLHADIPGIDVVPGGPNGETWYVSTDGGLYRSADTLQTVENLSLAGLRVSQYYSTLTSAADPDHVAAGSQDQGYQWAGAPPGEGTVLEFDQRISGDYGHLSSGDGTHAWVFSTYPGFVLVHRNEGSPILHTVSFPPNEGYAWMPPVVGDPLAPTDFFFCARQLYRYQKSATGYDWTPAAWSTEDFADGASAYCSALAFSPLDPNLAWAATNTGVLYWSVDRGVTWTQSASLGPGAHYFYGTALLASATDPTVVYVGGSGYGVPAVYRSADGGQTYQPWSDGLPSTLVYCLGEQPDGTGTIYAGTETAAYRREAAGAAWEDITGNEAPITIYWSVEALAHENTLRFGTYGRGIWDYQVEPPASWSIYGCGGNPAGSLVVLGGMPRPGQSMVLGLDNPLGTMNPGALAFGFFSLAPDAAYPCGTMVPGFGMAGGGAAGELLISVVPPDPALTIVGFPWGGVGQPAWVNVAIPNDSALLGLQVYGQGLLLDPSRPAYKCGLTEGIELVIGV